MPISLGTTTITALYLGTTAISAAYLGTTEVFSSGPALDPDASAYIAAVEVADGQALEAGVKTAINTFVVGCKADGIWAAIKASCILAGARTLNGAIVPLAGTAPTNINFVSGDYNRKTGLVGNGTTKRLDSNRLDSADPENNMHFSIFLSNAGTTTVTRTHIGTSVTAALSEVIAIDNNTLAIRNRTGVSGASNFAAPAGSSVNFIGASRSASGSYTARFGGASNTVSAAAQGVTGTNFGVFARGNGSVFSNCRASFYSIGEGLNLAQLDARVSTLMTDFGSAIP